MTPSRKTAAVGKALCVVGLGLASFLAADARAETMPVRLRCEYRVDPVGIDVARPRLSWQMQSETPNQRQTAYRVVVDDIWDSGRVTSEQSVGIVYAGKALESGRRYSWKVMVWDRDGRPSRWSTPATFVTGRMQPGDWRGQWIGASKGPNHQPVYLRREFEVGKPVMRATAFFCGLGWSELFINGKRVGDYLMGPGQTTYDKRTQYLVFDVTEQLRQPGKVTLDVVLFDGWYALSRDPWVHNLHRKPYVDQPKLLLDVQLEHADGTTTTLTSDPEWRWSHGPIRASWICEQNVDFRVTPGPWQPVSILPGPTGRLVAQREPPTRVVENLQPVSMTETNGEWTFQFDREFTGFVSLRTAGPAGTAVYLNTHPAKLGPRKFSFTLKGEGIEEFAPRQTYTAIVRVSVRGLARPPALADLTGHRITGVGVEASSFRCSDETINWIHEAARRTQANYVTFLPNDPTREFKAWTQDIQNMFWSAMYLFDSQAMYERWQYDLIDGQAADGNLPNVAPGPVFDDYNSPWWGGCGVWLPWELWQRTGDDRMLRESYETMQRYVDFLAAQSRDGLQDWGLGDWTGHGSGGPRTLVNTAAAFHYAQIVSRTAERLGRTEEAKRYASLAQDIRDKFNAKFLKRDSGSYGGSQAGQAMALALGLVPDELRPKAIEAFKVTVASKKIAAYFVGAPFVLQMLAEHAPEIGYAITTRREAPSWYSMTKGAGNSQMMETWDGGQAFMPSLGGNIAAWNIEALAGIRPDPSGPGYKKFMIQPVVVGDLKWVDCWYDSPHGRIVSNWRREGDKLTMDVVVPANTTATIYVPGEPPRTVGSGRHQFVHRYPAPAPTAERTPAP